MAKVGKGFVHPAFGVCEQVPSVVAIKWESALEGTALSSKLAAHGLELASEVPPIAPPARDHKRDPRLASVNQSAALSFVTKAKAAKARSAKSNFADDAFEALNADDAIAWAAPVYRATSADEGPQSWFAVDPTVVLMSAQVATAVGAPSALEPSATIDAKRSALLKGFVVVTLPERDAIDFATKVSKLASAQGLTGGVKLESIPYLSPLCCGCGGNAGTAGAGGAGAGANDPCAPQPAPELPNDTFFVNQWGLQRINAPNAWATTEGDPNVVVAVLDQGVELGHPDLDLWPLSYSTVTHTDDGSPVGDHGTACAGIIGARIDNGLGVAGLAGRCRVMAIATTFADTQVAEGLYFAADNGARVVSMSFGVYPAWMVWDFSIIQAALQYCQDKGLVLVAASGNENLNVSRFPGSDPRTICVGGSNRDDLRKSIGDTSIENWWGACFGPDLDVVAPCLEIPTTDRLGPLGYTGTDYDMRFNGTSSATPHVAALAGLVISINPALSAMDVRRIISETTDKISPLTYGYLATPGKPFGVWNNEVGYGRINAERAVLVACAARAGSATGDGSCAVTLPRPDTCCVSPCDPPWRPDSQCLVWYETRFFRAPLTKEGGRNEAAAVLNVRQVYLEFRITYEHKLCLLGKQHGPLLYTVTLLPGEKVTLYHSDRYRQITSTQERFSVQTTFMQFLSVVHQARLDGTLDALSDTLSGSRSGSSSSSGGGVFLGIGGLGGSSSSSSESSFSDREMLAVKLVSDQFNQSVAQSSQLTQAERSLVVSTYEDKDSLDVTARELHNANDCRAVTYFVRKVMELYAVSTTVTDVSYRVVAPNVPPDWHSVNDVSWLPQPIQNEIAALAKLLPKVGDTIEKPRPVSLPTDGAVYDPELAHCCSCEPEKAAALSIALEKQKAAALKACLEAQLMQAEVDRRRMLLQKGNLDPFGPPPPAAPSPAGSSTD